MLYSDVLGQCSYCQGQEPPLHAGGVLPFQLLGNCPALKRVKQVKCQEQRLAARCRGAGPPCMALGRGRVASSLLGSTEVQRIYRSSSRHCGQALRQPFSPPLEPFREGV